MLNDEIKDYWEDESYVYSDIIKKSLDDEGKNAWADLVLGNAPKKEKLEPDGFPGEFYQAFKEN